MASVTIGAASEENVKNSPFNGTSASGEPAMSDRRSEIEAVLSSSSPDRRSKNRSKPPLAGSIFHVARFRKILADFDAWRLSIHTSGRQ